MVAAYAAQADASDFNNGQVTASKPTGTASGDLLVAVAVRYEDAGNSAVGMTMSGWTQQATNLAGSTYRMKVFYRVAGGAEPSTYSCVYGTAGDGYGASLQITRVTSADTSSPFDAGPAFQGSTSASSSLVAPSVSPTRSDSLLLCAWLFEENFTNRTATVPGGMTAYGTYPAAGGLFDLVGGYQALSASGATGTRTATLSSGTVANQHCVSMAIKSPAGPSFTGTAAVVAGATGASLTTGMTGTAPVAVAGTAGALRLGMTLGGTAAVTAGATGAALGVVSRIFTGVLEIEFTPGSWTDVTSRMNLASSTLTIRQGRPTEFDDVGAGQLSVSLWNDDGALMPDNSSSAYYPNVVEGKRIRWRISKSGTTWTRFQGWITALLPDFPSSSTTGAVVAVVATDALGLLAQRRLRSNWTERALALARSGAVACDAWEATGTANGFSARLTNYSTDAGKATSSVAYNGSWPTLSFSSDRDTSVGGVVTCNPDSNGNVCATDANFQAGHKTIQYLIKTPTTIPSATPFFVGSLYDNYPVGSALGHLVIESDGAGDMRLAVYNAAGSSSLGTIRSPAPHGQWMLIRITQNGGTPTRSDFSSVDLGSGATGSLTSVAIDVRTIREVEVPRGTGGTSATSYGGFIGLGQTTGPAAADAIPAGAQGTLSSRLDSLAAACSMLPIGWTKVGSLSTQVLTGQWDRYALDVLQEMMRSGSGVAWARSRDSQIMAVDAASCRPASPIATIDVDADCAGPPRLARVVDTRPTRIQVDTPAGSQLVVDAVAEAGPGTPQRSRTVSTVCASLTDAAAVGTQLLATSTSLRITELTVDLTTGRTDHTAEFFSEAGALTGLYPTVRVRTTVPASHFGSSSRDHYVQGWREEYSHRTVRVVLDTTPAP